MEGHTNRKQDIETVEKGKTEMPSGTLNKTGCLTLLSWTWTSRFTSEGFRNVRRRGREPWNKSTEFVRVRLDYLRLSGVPCLDSTGLSPLGFNRSGVDWVIDWCLRTHSGLLGLGLVVFFGSTG